MMKPDITVFQMVFGVIALFKYSTESRKNTQELIDGNNIICICIFRGSTHYCAIAPREELSKAC